MNTKTDENKLYYEISIEMPEDSPSSFENIVLRGFNINSKFQYVSGYIPAKKWSEYQGLVNIYAVYSDQNREIILREQNIEYDIDFYIPPDTKEVVVESSDGSFLVKREYYHKLTIYLFLKRRTREFTDIKIHSKNVVRTVSLH